MRKWICAALCFALILMTFCGCDMPEFDIPNPIDYLLSYDEIESVSEPASAVLEPTPIVASDDMLCYNTLCEDMQKMYSVLLTGINGMVSGWIKLPVATENYESDIITVIYAIEDDHPEIFWMGNEHLVKEVSKGAEKSVLVAFDNDTGDNRCSCLFDKKQVEKMSGELDQKVSEIVSRTDGMSDFEKELYFNDYLCQNTTYEENADSTVYTAYGALIKGKAVCSGYAKAMQLLLKKAGIKNIVCHGTTDGQNHIWNVVMLDGKWYHTDVTWNDDDVNDITLYRYFNITEKEILKDHTASPLYTAASIKERKENSAFNYFNVRADDTKYNYYSYFTLRLTNSDYNSLARAIYEDFGREAKYTQFEVTDSEILSGFENTQTSVSKLQRALNKAASGKKRLKIVEYCVVYNIVLLFW